MTIQITVRLDDDAVAFADWLVKEGRATSRATAISRALLREQRREAAARDARILAATSDPDLESFLNWVSERPATID